MRNGICNRLVSRRTLLRELFQILRMSLPVAQPVIPNSKVSQSAMTFKLIMLFFMPQNREQMMIRVLIFSHQCSVVLTKNNKSSSTTYNMNRELEVRLALERFSITL